MKIELPEPLPYSAELPVRITDVNYGGHLGNDALVSLLHEARVAFLGHHGFSEGDCGGAGIVVSELEIAYRAEAFYGDVLSIAVGVGAIGRSRADLFYRVERSADAREIARARTTIAFFDYAARRPRRTPERFLDTFCARSSA
ncbi:acyl-CoA thioesterase [Halorhodospira halophila]|nr:thioesterase family protein [Halorhodospira halophila]